MQRVPLAAWLALLATLLLGVGWGAHAPYSWDVDNIAPGSVLKAIAARFGPGWSSSYGPVPYLLLGALYAPILLFFRLSGELGVPMAEFPWGFRNPETSIGFLIIVARLVCVVLAMGLAWLALGEHWTGPAPARAAEPQLRNPAGAGRERWLIPILLAGSPTFVFYARTTNVDMFYLFFLALAFHLAFHLAAREGGWRTLAAAGAAAALAVCCKEQSAPFAAAALAGAIGSALGAPVSKAVRLRGALAVLSGALLTYVVVWGLPFNASGWVTHHRFLFEQARYPRAYPATPSGFFELTGRAGELLPVSLGWPVIVGALFALFRPAQWMGLAPRAVGVFLYAAGFLAVVGYVYPRFLLPLMLLALPLAIRGWNSIFERAGSQRAPVVAVLLMFAAVGGPLLGVAQWRDTRYLAAERLAAHRASAPDPPRVEIIGNPRFQARVPAGYASTVILVDTLGRVGRGPQAEFVLISGFDRYQIAGDSLLRRTWLDPLNDPHGEYVQVWDIPPGRWSRPLRGLPFSPVVWGWKRRR
ncbi:MAG: glycosyltransferase family 39 protein [Candidatus Eisenbacteria bacterium]